MTPLNFLFEMEEKEMSLISKKRTGFTLVEGLVVVVILGLLAALVAPKIVGQCE